MYKNFEFLVLQKDQWECANPTLQYSDKKKRCYPGV